MARPDGLYSRVIAGLKILLPLAALGLLSTLFLFSGDRADVPTVPFADALGVGQTARQQVGAPYYSGTTARGDGLTMTAQTAAPIDDGRIEAVMLEATLAMQDGSRIVLASRTATIANDAREAELTGGVTIDSSTGYSLKTDTLTASLDRSEAETGGPVFGQGPSGTLEAGRLQIRTQGDDGDMQLLFTDGVKLIYEPEKD